VLLQECHSSLSFVEIAACRIGLCHRSSLSWRGSSLLVAAECPMGLPESMAVDGRLLRQSFRRASVFRRRIVVRKALPSLSDYRFNPCWSGSCRAIR
jgi:hypothetical protein